MSAIDQAFVKAYARRQRTSNKPAASTSTDDGVVVDRSVADTASVWIDQDNDTTVRIDAAHSANRQSATPKSEPAVVAKQPGVKQTAVVANAPSMDKPPAVKPPAVKAPEVKAQPAAAPIQHVHTAYAIVEGDSSWMHAITSASLIATTVERRISPEIADSIAIAQPNRVDQRGHAIEPPHARTAKQTDSHQKSTSVSKLAPPTVVAPQPIAKPSPAPAVAVIAPVVPPQPEAAPTVPASPEVTHAPVGETKAEAETEPTEEPIGIFQAKWEIDALDIPTVVAELFFDGELFQQVAEQLAEAASSGLKRVLVTSVHAGEGRSTVAIGLAIAAAASGKRVALIDADATAPTLVDDLRLELEFGWIEAIRGRLPLEEVCVLATQDGVTLVPLMTPHGATAATSREVRAMVDLLEPHFDLLIVDGGSSQCSATLRTLGQYDSAMIVFDKTRTATVDINEYSYQLRFSGVSGVGVVENFVS